MLLAVVLLVLAIAAEVGATIVLPRAEGFSDLGWSAVVVGGYGLSIWLLMLVVRTIPISVTYAVWAGLGTAAVALLGVLLLGEPLGWVKGMSIALIVLGVVGLNLSGA